ncbi:ABC transporter substrate-binding protein [Solihabitans fulvus]|uniref:ABC transporter substrate-binding protein n=1 Tax=Solihabitans fulvus TaxID=1892852 RepID=A0A5B2WRH1_9PSEU|nr:ABC transporter substrate-binding protein [Solihabitans fulvus]KAA2253578.1 ABC transporter substrate-binding protein [Solihabitans fulvus]
MRTSLRRGASWLALTLVAATAVTACSSAATSGGSGQQGADSASAPGPEALNGKGEVPITFWHAMTGANGDALQKLTDKFNQANQGKVKVTLAFKNNYDDTLSAYKNAIKGGQMPDVVQVYDIGTRFMIDSKSTLPVQAFIDKDKYDTSDIQPNIAGYYSINGKLNSMPFNTSMPLLYINKTAFTKAGLDPSKPPTTLDEIAEAAKKLTVKDASGNVTQYGFGATAYGWFVEQWAAVANQESCDQGNGRDNRATKINLADDKHIKLFQWWQDLVKQGVAMPLDSDTKNGDTAFSSGKVAISLESTGSLGGFLKASAGAFEIGTGYYPKIDSSDTGGPIIGGASLWVVGKDKDDAHKRASWEFLKFLSDKDSQATWHTSTGYFPISKSALETDVDKQWVAQKPQFATAIKQLGDTKLTKATQGCLLGVMPQARKAVDTALQATVLQGKDVKETLQGAEKNVEALIKEYNQSVGG